MQLADIPPSQSATLGFHPIACRLLLISHPAEPEGKKLSSPELNVNTYCNVHYNMFNNNNNK